MQRVFDAPRALVWKAYTDPKLIPQWWGPGYLTTKVEEIDVRPGGRWRYVQRDPDGHEYAFHGEYREVAPPERLASTFIFEGQPGESSLDIATFEEVDGKTRLTVRSVFDSAGGRDGMYAEGMEEGMIEGYNRLSALLRKLNAQPQQA